MAHKELRVPIQNLRIYPDALPTPSGYNGSISQGIILVAFGTLDSLQR